MFGVGIIAVARSPLARVAAVAVADFLAARGFIQISDVSQVVEDVINIISFGAFAVYLAIWQWRSHHPAKIQIDAEVPQAVPAEEIAKTKRNFVESLKAYIVRVFFTPKPVETPVQ